MTLDPETWISATEIALVGGLTGAFSQDIYNSGRNWILTRFMGHPKEAQESAQHNVNNFFGEVNIRVGALEKSHDDIEDKEKLRCLIPIIHIFFMKQSSVLLVLIRSKNTNFWRVWLPTGLQQNPTPCVH